MKTLKLIKNESKRNSTINRLAARMLQLKGEASANEQEQAEVRAEMLALMDAEKSVVLVTPEFSVTRSEVTRENFCLAKAKPVLGNILSPFISCTSYTTLKVNQQGAACARQDNSSKRAA